MTTLMTPDPVYTPQKRSAGRPCSRYVMISKSLVSGSISRMTRR